MIVAKTTSQRPRRVPDRRRRGVVGSSLRDFDPLLPAEESLLEACRLGRIAVIGDDRPEVATDANRIRAQFIRFLAVGGDEEAPVHDSGVHLDGAWVDGMLDLFAATVERPLLLRTCRMEAVFMPQASVAFLSLQRCLVAGQLQADGLRCRDDLRLDGVEVKGPVWLADAAIGGDLDCRHGHFADGLGARRAAIGGSVYLESGFVARNTVNLTRARIGGDLVCRDAQLCGHPDALRCDDAYVEGSLVFHRVSVGGGIDLGATRVASLDDDLGSWQGAAGALILDGFTYDRFSGAAPIDHTQRVGWLLLQPPAHIGDELRTQPWDQLGNVLRGLGHIYEARAVAIAKETRLRLAGRIPRGVRTAHWLYGQILGYGYRPGRLVGLTVAIWLICAALYWAAVNPQWFGGTTRLIQPKPGELSAACLVARAAARSGDPCPSPEPDYRSFNPFTYSANVLLPAVTLDYTGDWRPVVASPDGRPLIWGKLLRVVHAFETLFGLFLGLQLAGMFGSLIKKN